MPETGIHSSYILVCNVPRYKKENGINETSQLKFFSFPSNEDCEFFNYDKSSRVCSLKTTQGVRYSELDSELNNNYVTGWKSCSFHSNITDDTGSGSGSFEDVFDCSGKYGLNNTISVYSITIACSYIFQSQMSVLRTPGFEVISSVIRF